MVKDHAPSPRTIWETERELSVERNEKYWTIVRNAGYIPRDIRDSCIKKHALRPDSCTFSIRKDGARAYLTCAYHDDVSGAVSVYRNDGSGWYFRDVKRTEKRKRTTKKHD